ncbi:hypothetical protein EEB13_05565 [Rhodococcus sp. WS3]|uniref:phage gene 29 protein family protein n=1 Tax=Rhodococcus sp. WS3 TaxID=2486271 RepID=UPI001141B3F4|nr:hypothetical protein [Rhodococcus sp. WS3]ROZ49391.1 hypothetical protein EEB13_05565 [Rhodococcus sp. WS3]
MDTSQELSPELHEALPPDMHPYAYAFMHPTMQNTSPKFEPDEMNDLGRHLEQLGFRPVADCLIRYEPPVSGPVHPHNPSTWVPKGQARKRPLPTVADRIVAQLDKLPDDQRAEVVARMVAEQPEEQT